MGTSQSKKEKLQYYLETHLLTSIYPSPHSVSLKTRSRKPQKLRPQHAQRIILDARPVDKKRETVLSIIDHRVQVINTHEWPYSVHGVVAMKFNEITSWGTGILIGPNIVLTAGHNLYNHENKTSTDPKNIQFLPAMNGQILPFGKIEVEQYFVSPGYINNMKEDYGILILKKPIGETTGYFGLACLDPAEISTKQINVTGYPADKVASKPKTYEMWGMEGQVSSIDENDEKIHYLIDTEAGQSGSGVWFQEGEDYYVCGVHVLGGHAVNTATLLTRKCYQQIHEWIQQAKCKEFILELEETTRALKFGQFKVDAECISLLMKYNLNNLATLDLEGKEIGPEGAIELAKNTSWVRLAELDLFQNNIGPEGARALAQNPHWTNLQILHLDQNNIGSKGAQYLAGNTSWTSLFSLNLSGNNLEAKGIELLAQNTSWTNLSKLYLANNNIGAAGAEALAQNPSWKNLSVLYLNGNNLGSEGAKALAKNSSWFNLQLLFLKNNRLRVEGAGALSQNSSWRNLQELYIGANKINNEGIQALAQNTSWENLALLDLNNNKISTADKRPKGPAQGQETSYISDLSVSGARENNLGVDGIRALHINPSWGKLSRLNLSWNNLNAEGAKELSWMKLQVLNLKNNNPFTCGTLPLKRDNIGAEGAEFLAKNNPEWTNLEELDLYNNNIGPKGAKALAENSSWSNLRKLSLARNNIGSEGAEGLAKNESWINLCELNLGGNNIEAEGANGLAMNISWVNLSVLHLTWNDIGVKGAKGLVKNTSWVNLTKLRLYKTNLGREGVEILSKNEYWPDFSYP